MIRKVYNRNREHLEEYLVGGIMSQLFPRRSMIAACKDLLANGDGRWQMLEEEGKEMLVKDSEILK